MRGFSISLLFALLIFAPRVITQAQTTIEISRVNASREAATTRYRYVFENQRFTTPRQEIEFDGSGRGQFSYKRKDVDEIVNKLEVTPPVLSEIQGIFDEMNFLGSSEDYQHKKDFSHLGKVTITLVRNGKERTVSFNYTDNHQLNRLRDIFNNIATQETRFFEIETIKASDPLSTPAQLRLLENELRSKHIADPHRFTLLLQDIKMDEGLPLIARNHADRLLQMIKKGK